MSVQNLLAGFETIAKTDQAYVLRQGGVVEEGPLKGLSIKLENILSTRIAAQQPIGLA